MGTWHTITTEVASTAGGQRIPFIGTSIAAVLGDLFGVPPAVKGATHRVPSFQPSGGPTERTLWRFLPDLDDYGITPAPPLDLAEFERIATGLAGVGWARVTRIGTSSSLSLFSGNHFAQDLAPLRTSPLAFLDESDIVRIPPDWGGCISCQGRLDIPAWTGFDPISPPSDPRQLPVMTSGGLTFAVPAFSEGLRSYYDRGGIVYVPPSESRAALDAMGIAERGVLVDLELPGVFASIKRDEAGRLFEETVYF